MPFAITNTNRFPIIIPDATALNDGVMTAATFAAIFNPTPIAPLLLNGSTNLGAGFQLAQYTKDAGGFIHLDGVLNPVGPNTIIFNLPAGYRPTNTVLAIFAGSTGGTFTAGRINIDNGGDVTVISGGGDFVSLAGITFLATQ